MNDGGPAFPRPKGAGFDIAQTGMTLRDYFAAQAMQAQLGLAETHRAIGEGKLKPQEVVANCYDWADGMLAERQKEAK